MRINKYLAEKNICSRREADKLIENGQVLVNGLKAVLGQDVNELDEVKIVGKTKQLFYVAYNKPVGIVTNCPQSGEKEISDILKLNFEYFPVGRLDKNSRGLIILTNDGRVTDRLLSPRHYHEKEYDVTVSRRLQDKDLEQMSHGMDLSGGIRTKKCEIEKLDNYTFSIVLTEGKNRQIRRMCEALGYDVTDLNRVRIMNIEPRGLREGQYRILAGEELRDFLEFLSL